MSIEVHNRDKSFKCEKCPFSSARNSNLEQHIAGVHGEIRSHKCDECGYAANQKNDLLRHQIRAHKEKTP